MRPPVRILFVILILFFGYQAIQVEFGGYEIGLFESFKYFNIILVIIFTIIIVSKDIDIFRNHKKLYHFIPTLIGVTIITIVAVRIAQRSLINSSPTVLSVSHIPKSVNAWTFDFKKNGNYKLTDYNLLGQTIYYGDYSMAGDSIVLKESNYDGNVNYFPKKGVIRNDTVFWDKFDTMIIKKPED